jgi:hypothetical protein
MAAPFSPLTLYDYVRCGPRGLKSLGLACEARSLVRVSRRDPPLGPITEHLRASACASALAEARSKVAARRWGFSAFAPSAQMSTADSHARSMWRLINALSPFTVPGHGSRLAADPLGPERDPRGSKQRTTSIGLQGRLHWIRIDGLLAALTGCFAHFPHGTCMLSDSRMEI